jgi:predicted metalloprotease
VKWKRRKSKDVIDVRGAGPKAGSGSGGLGGLPIPSGMAGAGGGIGLVVILVIVGIQLFSGGGGGGSGFDITDVFDPGATAPGVNDPQPIPPGEDPQRELKDFSTYVFEDSQDTWDATFEDDGDRYENAQLVLFSGGVNTGGCGSATSAVGPFYCPADQRVYLDLSFYDEMERQLGGGGDFAWAYVIAHEMGHHVQNESGTSDEVTRLEQENPGDAEGANGLSVRLELQADCYAGVWASTVYSAGDLEAGDLDEAFSTAEAIGDDRLQSRGGGVANPDSFTHGTSEQRRRWFNAGYEGGVPAACDTFAVDEV